MANGFWRHLGQTRATLPWQRAGVKESAGETDLLVLAVDGRRGAQSPSQSSGEAPGLRRGGGVPPHLHRTPLERRLASGLTNDENRSLELAVERRQGGRVLAQQRLYLAGGAVSNSNPDDLRQPPGQKAPIREVGIASDNDKALPKRDVPEEVIRGPIQVEILNMDGARIQVAQGLSQARGEILVEKELHATHTNWDFSRSAA